MLDALAVGVSADPSAAGASGNLEVGQQRISGDHATVSLVGKLCKDAGSNCIENHDASTMSPMFLVNLQRGSDERWYVRFGPPGSAPGDAPSTTPPSSP
jgi:hypothetical protein